MIEIGTSSDGDVLALDASAFIGAHSCVVGNTGSGKSNTIRKILEATYGETVHIVFDPEDEFHTLRQAHSYVLVGGQYADVPLGDPAHLARSVARCGTSVVIQLNELEADDQALFMADFLDALMALPRSAWRPMLIVLDEVHRYAPQAGGSPALRSINELLARGRKRGFGALLASQRLAKVNKNAIAEVTNWFIGRTSPNDRRRSGDMLGFKANKDEERGLTHLSPGDFWCFGPAFAPRPKLVHVDRVQTIHLTLGTTWVPPHIDLDLSFLDTPKTRPVMRKPALKLGQPDYVTGNNPGGLAFGLGLTGAVLGGIMWGLHHIAVILMG